MRKCAKICRGAICLAVPFFWFFLLLGTQRAGEVLCSLIAAACHEVGHLIAFLTLQKRLPGVKIGVRGAVFLPAAPLSYRAEIAVCAAGPLANLACALLFFPAGRLFGSEYLAELASFELFTGLFNLCPAPGYDGEKILADLAARRLPPDRAAALRESVSFPVCTLLCLGACVLLCLTDSGLFSAPVFLFCLCSRIPDGPSVQITSIREKKRDFKRI